MKKERIPEVHFYEWSISRWLGSETRMLLDSSGRGIYRELIDRCYKDGSIPADHSLQASMAGCSTTEIERVWPLIRRHFRVTKKDGARLENLCANLFRKSFFQYVARQKKNGSKGGAKRGIDKSSGDSELVSTGLPSAEKVRKPNVSQAKRETEREKKTETETERETETALALRPPPGALIEDPFDAFRRVFTGPIPDNTYQAFGSYVKTPEDAIAIVENTALWMHAKKYSDGFHDAVHFIKSGVWRNPPKPELLNQQASQHLSRSGQATVTAAQMFLKGKR